MKQKLEIQFSNDIWSVNLDDLIPFRIAKYIKECVKDQIDYTEEDIENLRCDLYDNPNYLREWVLLDLSIEELGLIMGHIVTEAVRQEFSKLKLKDIGVI